MVRVTGPWQEGHVFESSVPMKVSKLTYWILSTQEDNWLWIITENLLCNGSTIHAIQFSQRFLENQQAEAARLQEIQTHVFWHLRTSMFTENVLTSSKSPRVSCQLSKTCQTKLTTRTVGACYPFLQMLHVQGSGWVKGFLGCCAQKIPWQSS
jgi:hypothetical protein